MLDLLELILPAGAHIFLRSPTIQAPNEQAPRSSGTPAAASDDRQEIINNLPDHQRNVYHLMCYAVEKLGEEVVEKMPYKQIFAWLKQQKSDHELPLQLPPSAESFGRYWQSVCKQLGFPLRRSPRAGRLPGRSVVSARDI